MKVTDATAALRAGGMVVVTDADGPGGAVLAVAAEHATAGVVNVMATHARGLISLALTPERCHELQLALMGARGDTGRGPAFTVSIEAREGITTGISAADRARTVAVAIDPRSTAADVVRPGHVFPVRAQPGGVLERRGHAEAAVDLARLAGLLPAGVVCELLDDDGAVADASAVGAFCARHDVPRVSIDALVAHRREVEERVERVVAAALRMTRATEDVAVTRALAELGVRRSGVPADAGAPTGKPSFVGPTGTLDGPVGPESSEAAVHRAPSAPAYTSV